MACMLGINARGRALFILVIIALAVGVGVRTQRLGALRPYDSDERVWILQGAMLLKTGAPAAWTRYWEKYPPAFTTAFGGQNQVMVSPFLDHPPLFGLAMGAWAMATGNDTAAPFNWALLRLPMITLALGTLVFTWLFVRRLFTPVQAAITAVAFAFFPAHSIASRFIVAENAIAFLLILGLYAFAMTATAERQHTRQAKLATAIIAVICIIAIWLKLSAIIIPATLGLLALLKKNWRLFTIITAATLVSLVLFVLYGAYYDWSIFRDVLAGHLDRQQSFWHFWSVVTQMDLGNYQFSDPSIIVGFIGLFTLLANQEIPWDRRLYVFAPLFMLSLLFLQIAPVESYGWYKYVWFPLLAIGLGYVFTELVKGRMAYYVLLLPFIALALERSNIITIHAYRKMAVMILYGLVVAAIIAAQRFPKQKILAVTGVASLAILFLLELTWISTVLSNSG